jgi:hypothetical protein
MKKNKTQAAVTVFTEEKLAECRHMSPLARLRWLEEANTFINKALGLRRRAEIDPRFSVYVKRRK